MLLTISAAGPRIRVCLAHGAGRHPRRRLARKGAFMTRTIRSGFRSAEAALRFFFRMRTLLCGSAEVRSDNGTPLRTAGWRGHGALCDYLRVWRCVNHLDDDEFSSIGREFGPRWFVRVLEPKTFGTQSFAYLSRPHRRCRMGNRRHLAVCELKAAIRRRFPVAASPAHRAGHFSRASRPSAPNDFKRGE